MTQDTLDLALVERKKNDEAARRLQEQGLSGILAQLFSARGINDIGEVRAKISDLEPVSTLKNAPEMGKILADCVESQERVLIVSDYDCDGATACSVLIRAFQGAKMNFGFLVPDRFKHGYGLTPSIVDEAAAQSPKPRYIITVDNGISSSAGVERALEHGIEVLVTDHHLCPSELPKARLIVNPQQPDCDFKSKSIAGCGVAWYVASALFHELQQRKIQVNYRPADLLPYVAIGTVADVVKLDKNNRILVREGLERIRRGECAYGIQELVEVSKRVLDSLTCQDLGFAVGPRINAAGRLEHMQAGIECLTTRDPDLARELAQQLHAINEQRKELQKQIAAQAEELTRDHPDSASRMSVVVYEPDWHEGVVGIVAGRMKDQMHRPAFVLTKDSEGHIKGSGRSIGGFHLKHALDRINVEHPGVLIRFGGHAAAAGVTIEKDALDEFTKAFERVCKEELTPDMLTPKLEHDGALPHFAYNEQAVLELNREIWGQGFPQPMFVDKFEVASARQMGVDGSHLKVMVKKGEDAYDMVAFGEGAHVDNLPEQVEVAFTPSLNVWRGRISIQLMSERMLNLPKLQAQLKPQEPSESPKTSADDAKKFPLPVTTAANEEEPAAAEVRTPASARFASLRR